MTKDSIKKDLPEVNTLTSRLTNYTQPHTQIINCKMQQQMFVWDKEEHRTRDYPPRPAGDSTFDRSSRGQTARQGSQAMSVRSCTHTHTCTFPGLRESTGNASGMWTIIQCGGAGSVQEWQEKRPERQARNRFFRRPSYTKKLYIYSATEKEALQAVSERKARTRTEKKRTS